MQITKFGPRFFVCAHTKVTTDSIHPNRIKNHKNSQPMEDKKWIKLLFTLAVIYIVACIIVAIIPFFIYLGIADLVIDFLREYIKIGM